MARIPRFVFTPRWIALLVFALVVAATCVRLGIWQLDRLDQRRALNAQVERGLAAEPVPVGSLLPPTGPTPALEDLAYRRITAVGTFDPSHEVLWYGRSLDGSPGHHVLTPLLLQDGRALIVDRGWVPSELDVPPIAEAAPPQGEVEITGFLLPPSGAEGDAAAERAADGRLLSVTEPDVATIAPELPAPPVAMVLQLQSMTPAATTELPRAVPPPELSEGPHSSYAVQWFIFATIALVGYVVLVRREVRDRARAAVTEAR